MMWVLMAVALGVSYGWFPLAGLALAALTGVLVSAKTLEPAGVEMKLEHPISGWAGLGWQYVGGVVGAAAVVGVGGFAGLAFTGWVGAVITGAVIVWAWFCATQHSNAILKAHRDFEKWADDASHAFGIGDGEFRKTMKLRELPSGEVVFTKVGAKAAHAIENDRAGIDARLKTKHADLELHPNSDGHWAKFCKASLETVQERESLLLTGGRVKNIHDLALPPVSQTPPGLDDTFGVPQIPPHGTAPTAPAESGAEITMTEEDFQ